MSDRHDAGMKRCWDHDDCPRDDCDGELEQQDKYNVMCMACTGVWAHVTTDQQHHLQTEDFETVAEKPVSMTDGDTKRSGSRVCRGCGNPVMVVDDGRRAACPDCGNDWNIGPDPCQRCNGDGQIWVSMTDAPCPDCTPYPEPGERYVYAEDEQ